MLCLARRVGENLIIGKSGDVLKGKGNDGHWRAHLTIQADHEIAVDCKEIAKQKT